MMMSETVHVLVDKNSYGNELQFFFYKKKKGKEKIIFHQQEGRHLAVSSFISFISILTLLEFSLCRSLPSEDTVILGSV